MKTQPPPKDLKVKVLRRKFTNENKGGNRTGRERTGSRERELGKGSRERGVPVGKGSGKGREGEGRKGKGTRESGREKKWDGKEGLTA